MNTIEWDDRTWQGKPWRSIAGGYGWDGRVEEALAAFASPGGCQAVVDAAEGTAGMLIPSTADAVRELARTGWEDGTALAMAVADHVALSPSSWPTEAVYDCYGDEPDVAAFALGLPEHMISWHEAPGSRAIGGYQKIEVFINAPYNLQPEFMALASAINMSFVDFLESGGVRVQITSRVLCSKNYFSGKEPILYANIPEVLKEKSKMFVDVRFFVKDYEEPLSPSLMSFWTGHPAALRGVFFGLFGGVKHFRDEMPNFGYPVCVLPDDATKYPFGGWSGDVVPVGLPDATAGGANGGLAMVFSSALCGAALIWKWYGKKAALQWLHHLRRAIEVLRMRSWNGDHDVIGRAAASATGQTMHVHGLGMLPGLEAYRDWDATYLRCPIIALWDVIPPVIKAAEASMPDEPGVDVLAPESMEERREYGHKT